MCKWQGELSARFFQPPRSDPVTKRNAFGGQDSVELPYRDVVRSGDAAGTEVRFWQVQPDIPHDPHEKSGLECRLLQLNRVEMGADHRPEQIDAGLTDDLAAWAIERSWTGGESVEVVDGHL